MRKRGPGFAWNPWNTAPVVPVTIIPVPPPPSPPPPSPPPPPPPPPPTVPLSAPGLDYPIPIAANPTSIGVHLGIDWISGYKLIVNLANNAGMSGATQIIHTITDAEAIAHALTLPLPTLAGNTWIQMWGRIGSIDSANFSNIVAWGDNTAPVITTAATTHVTETLLLADALTFTDIGGVGVPAQISNGTIPGWYIDSGADQLQVQVAIVTLNPFIQWINNGTQLTTSPHDQNIDNQYDYTIGCIDWCGNKTLLARHTIVDAADLTPNSFTFTAITNALRSTQYSPVESPVTISGLGTGINAPSSISEGQYSKNGGAWTAAGSFTLQNGDTLGIRDTSSSLYATLTTQTVIVGTYSTSFLITTMNDPSKVNYIPSTNSPANSQNNGGASPSFTFTGIDFKAGYGLVFVNRTEPGNTAVVKILGAGTGGADITLVLRASVNGNASERDEWWACPDASPIVADGTYTVTIVESANANFCGIMTGTLTNTSTSVPTGTQTAVFTTSTNPNTTSPLTISSTGVGVVGAWFGNGQAGTNNGTQVTTGLSGAGEIVRQINAGSWTPSLNSTTPGFASMIACMWG